MTRSGRKAALKVAFRNSVRNRKRTFFLVALVAVPVALAVVVAGLVRANTFTQEEQAQMEFGAAETKVRAYAGSIDASDEVMAWAKRSTAELAPETDSLAYRQAFLRFADDRYGRAYDLDLAAPLGRGILNLVDGSPPVQADEVALSPQFVDDLEASIGETVELSIDDTVGEYLLVGVVSPPIATTDYLIATTIDGLQAVAGEDTYIETILLIGGPGAVEVGNRLYETWWNEGKYSFWPEAAITPKPGELEFVDDAIYVLLDQAQVDELLTMARESTELGANGWDEQIYNRAFEMAEESGLTYNQVYTQLPDLSIENRQDWLNQGIQIDQQSSVASTGAAVLLLVEVAFVAGAAFAAGTRRRLREIGLLGANGASVKHIRVTVLGEGLAVGLIGSAVGVAMGVVVLLLGRPLIQRFATRLITGVGVSLLDIVGPVVVAVVAVVIAAWLPARTASKVPITTALQGRMPALAPRKWVVPVGGAMTGFGTLLVVVSQASNSGTANVLVGVGALMMVGGAALLASPILALISRLANRLPATGRLVLRDSGRHRTRSAVAVAATMVILLAPVTALTVTTMSARQDLVYGLPDPGDQLLLFGMYDSSFQGPFTPEVEPITDEDIASVASIVPENRLARFDALDLEAQLRPLFDPVTENQSFYEEESVWQAAEASPDLVTALAVPGLSKVLDDGEIVVLGMERGPTTVRLDGVEYAATEFPVSLLRFSMPRVLIPESRVGEFAEVDRQPLALFILDRPLTNDESRELYNDGSRQISSGYRDITPTQLYAIVFGATLLAVLIVVALVTAVSAAETDEEIQTIVAVGAPGSIRRRFLGLLTSYQTLVAGVLALPLGLLLVKVFSSANSYFYTGPFGQVSSSELVVPFWGLVSIAVGLPLIIGLLTTLSVRSAPVTPPRRPT